MYLLVMVLSLFLKGFYSIKGFSFIDVQVALVFLFISLLTFLLLLRIYFIQLNSLADEEKRLRSYLGLEKLLNNKNFPAVLFTSKETPENLLSVRVSHALIFSRKLSCEKKLMVRRLRYMGDGIATVEAVFCIE